MRILLAALISLAAAGYQGAAAAPKNIEACDIVTFASSPSPGIVIPEERWNAYRDEIAAILGSAETPTPDALQGIDDRLLAAQKSLLDTGISSSEPYQAYFASGDCKLLTDLDADAIDGVLAGAGASVPKASLDVARAIAKAARAQVEAINSAARFRSGADRALLNAQYYCFAAAAIHALLPPEQKKSAGLATLGPTIICADAGRE